MKRNFYSFDKPLMIISLMVCFNLSVFSQTEIQQEQPKRIDTEIFENSTHHWYEFFTDDYVISPLPGHPQYDETEIEKIADNILLFQRDNGGWPKNFDMRAILNDDQKAKLQAAKPVLHTTFDNATTHTQVLYLAQAYTITGVEKYKDGCLKGLDFMLSAQYPNGGWPQFYPPLPTNNEYSKHITFNDEAYVGIMNVLKCINDEDPSFAFVDKARREKVKMAFEKGLDCILKTQIIEDGVKKVWCQQHDENTLKPAWARTFEPPCFSNEESAPLVILLMSIDKPDKRVIDAVQGAVKWFNDSKIRYTRCIDDPTAPEYVSKHKVHKYDRRVVHDLNAPLIWTRYSELGTGRQMFCDRSSEVVYNMADLGRERRSGYRWYTYAPQQVMDAYPDWQQQWAKNENVLAEN